eukprot:Phypoly_transcript_14801.p1 GENE.Phypoly_transcript_14801~~Phypoly_transcript_14801.p1  ORF type:complete len:280 (-),score=51.13 Phypoly_transcript_14801:131-931(-)
MKRSVDLQVSQDGPVATITLSRPKKGNSISMEMVASLVANVKMMESDPSVRVIVLTGSGESFCTGMDLSLTPEQATRENLSIRASKGVEMFETLYHCSKPIITRINGPALGGGWGLVFATDIRIALRKSFFWFPDVKRGIVPAIISCYIVHEIGPLKAKDLMLTARRISADEAYQMGMLTAVVDTVEELDQKTKEFSQYLLAGASGALGETKKLINYILHPHTHSENIEYAKAAFANAVSGPEARYGIEAFKNKQEPDWTGFVAKL